MTEITFRFVVELSNTTMAFIREIVDDLMLGSYEEEDKHEEDDNHD